MIGEFAQLFRGEKTDSSATAAAPAKIERTPDDAYKTFGVAFRGMIDELVEMRVDLTDVNRNLAAGAGIPPQFTPVIVQLIARRQMQAAARRDHPDPDVNLDRLAGR